MATHDQNKSISMILKQKQQSRYASGGRGKPVSRGGARNALRGGPPGPDARDNLNPILPPTYPTAPQASPMTVFDLKLVPSYESTAKFFKSNYSLHVRNNLTEQKGAAVERYIDQYKSPLTVKPHLLPLVDDNMFPAVLNEAPANYKGAGLQRTRRKIEDLPDVDPEEFKDTVVKQEKVDEDEQDQGEVKQEMPEDLDDINNEDEFDEEMDLGTDYAQSYFDNGEGDDDDRDDDDGGIY